jgi:hypothetical protein
MLRYVCLVLAALIIGCPLHNPPDVEPVYPPSAVGEACANLRAIGCPEGQGSINGESCERTLTLATDLRPLPVTCWARARNDVEAKGCGSLRCVR